MRRALVPLFASGLVFACGDDGGSDGETSVVATETSTAADDDDDDDDDDSDDDDDDDADGTAGDDDDDNGDDDDDDDATDSGGPMGGPAGSCGMGGTKNEVVQITLDSPERWYLIGAPDTDEPLPLVLAFHGDEGDPFMSTRYIWGSWWEQNNPPFIVVMTKCPGCTSWYQGDTSANADYVWDVLADVASNHNVDVSRIYAVGFSGGSEFLAIHGWEFQDVFAGIQWTCGGGAYTPYMPPSRPDCKVHGRIVISADDFLWDGSQQLLARLQNEGHPHEFVEAQCNGHCCDTEDHNAGAWAWFQTVTKCASEVPGMCAELSDLPPAPAHVAPGLAAVPSPVGVDSTEHSLPTVAAPSFAAARDHFDRVIGDLAPSTMSTEEREVAFREAMAAYDSMLAAAHLHGDTAHAQLRARYPELRALMAELRSPAITPR